MDAVRMLGEQTFASLRLHNYRLYFLGQGLSDIGTWMQIVAIGWLVLDLTGSGVALGTVLAFRFAPMLALGLFAGGIVDRFDKRKLLYATQCIFLLLSALLGTLVFTGTIEMWMVFLVALFFGVADSVDRPARQTYVHEIVGPENLRNAVGLGWARANLARAVGPLFAGSLIASVGIVSCFFMNSLSYLFAIISLALMDKEEIHRERHEKQKIDHVFAGLRYVAATPLILTILIAMAIIGTFTYEFQTTLPLLARVTFLGDAADYAALLSAFGVGSIAGGLFSASRKEVGTHEFVLWAFLFGVSIVVVAFMPALSYAVIGMVFAGFFSISLSSTANTMVQLESAPHMRGRVMSLWTMALFGSTVVGAPIVGAVGEHVSPRIAVALGGLAAIIAAVYAAHRLLKPYRFIYIPSNVLIQREEETVEKAGKI